MVDHWTSCSRFDLCPKWLKEDVWEGEGIPSDILDKIMLEAIHGDEEQARWMLDAYRKDQHQRYLAFLKGTL